MFIQFNLSPVYAEVVVNVSKRFIPQLFNVPVAPKSILQVRGVKHAEVVHGNPA